MATDVTVIVPWGGNCPHRRRARDWVRSWYASHFPNWACVIARASADPWCKARAAMPAVEQSRSDTVVLADADVFCPTTALALDAVREGAAWAVPHDRVARLDQPSTERLLSGCADDPVYVERPYPPMLAGGLLVAQREVLLDVPLDARFTGWGQEDESWGYALTCLHGPPWQGTGELVHLWHPPQERQSRAIGSDEGWQLRRRYRRARNDPDAMRQLLQEAW